MYRMFWCDGHQRGSEAPKYHLSREQSQGWIICRWIIRRLDHSPLDHSPLDHLPLNHSPLDHSPLNHSPLDHLPLDHLTPGLVQLRYCGAAKHGPEFLQDYEKERERKG